ncbi:CAF17-like 4Fe-4S cluster assembly/insertion protein YgfZ [Nesterenkonia marinintestina]|uniref:CAF17-like 4Fe-4S cluster assembly/insertion protein YgfZ n=1 Tax=Nesterenkonia marinintestina TaxID=2979865 RepID=UPI0021C2357E|nr:folate-binding protein [Nesterenkonia sp. GX14115]
MTASETPTDAPAADAATSGGSPMLDRPGAVPGIGEDAGAAAHYGSPVPEQRALDAGRAVVDLSHRGVVTVTGADRLSWLTTLSSQQLTDLTPGESRELLMLDISGRIEQWAGIVDDGETAWLITEGSWAAGLTGWLDSMRFAMRVEVADRSADIAVLGSTEPLPEAALSAADLDDTVRWEDPWPRLGPGAASYAAFDEDDHPGLDWSWHLTLVPRAGLEVLTEKLAEAGLGLAGTWAAEALRVAARRPRLAREVDAKTIPHELDLIRTAVHLSKGCYKGQETVARVHNLGHPPRRLTFLHLDGSEHAHPRPGAEVLAPKDPQADAEALASERAVGVVTSVALHHEMGPIALAVLKRRADPEQQLVVRDTVEDHPSFWAASQEMVVRPDAGMTVGRPQGDFVRRGRR